MMFYHKVINADSGGSQRLPNPHRPGGDKAADGVDENLLSGVQKKEIVARYTARAKWIMENNSQGGVARRK